MRVVRDPNALRVAIARFTSRAGAEAAFFVGIWGKAAYEFHATPQEQALLMGSLGIFTLAGAAVAGVLVDRFNPKRVLMGAEILFVPSTLALVLPDSVFQMAAVVAVSAVFGAAVMTAVASFPPFLTDDAMRLHRINALVEGATSASFIFGPALGALIVRYASLDWIFVFDALTSVVAVWLIARVSIRPAQASERSSAVGELRAGFRFAYSHRALRLYLLIGTAVWISFGAFGALEPLFYRDVLGTGPEALGWVNMIFGLGLVSGSALVSRLPARFVGARTALLCAFGSGLGAVIYTGTDDLRMVVAGAIYWGVVLGVMLPVVRTLLQRDTPDQLIGRVMGVSHVHNQVGELLPLTFVPALAGTLGLQRVLVGSGMILMGVAVVGSPEAIQVDRGRRRVATGSAQVEPVDEPVSPNV
jgi:DHA3 family macrolide efflux protein-like MFS transporter